LTARDIPHQSTDSYDALFAGMESDAGVSQQEIRTAFESSFISGQSVPLRSDIPYEEALRLMIRLQDAVGLSIETSYKREYLVGEAYGHVLGYTGKMTEEEYTHWKEDAYQLSDSIGKSGVEKSYESTLHGTHGYRNVEVDFRGEETAIVSDIASEPGKNITLSLDSVLQEHLYVALKETIESKGLPGGSAVALDPRNGHVLALVSYPSYNSNAFVGGIAQDAYQQLVSDERQPLFHRAVSGMYPSGSTFKPIVAAAALEEGVVTPQTTVMSVGGITIDGGFSFPDWKPGGHGVTNVIKALAESVNTYFYLAGGGDNETTSGLGVERITDYGRRFGLDAPTGIDLPGEAAGFLPSKAWKEEFKNEPWYLGDTYHLAIGQGDILVTPLQVAAYTMAFANGGTLYQPTVVESLSDHTGAIVTTPEPVVIRSDMVSQSTMATVRKGMREAVVSGSARSLLSLPVTSAGKTGTAQFGSGEKTHSWFTAFAPYETPEIVISVIVEEAGQGNDAALPIVKEVLEEYFAGLTP
jgi:penicillin-binding protein 2